MTPNELREKLATMDKKEHTQFEWRFIRRRGRQFGQPPVLSVVDYFIEHPEDERLIADLLSLPTEADKSTRAAIGSASSARTSAIWAIVSAVVAFLSLVALVLFSCISK